MRIIKELLLHTSKDAVVIFITASSGPLVIFLIVCHTFFALFHLDVSIMMNLVTGIALCLARVLIWGQGRAREVSLVQVLRRNMRYGWCIRWKSDGNCSGSSSASKATREKLDGSCQALIFFVATDARGQWASLVARLTIVTEARAARNTSAMEHIGRRSGLVGPRIIGSAAVPLVPASVGPAAVGVEHVCLRGRRGVSRACPIVLF